MGTLLRMSISDSEAKDPGVIKVVNPSGLKFSDLDPGPSRVNYVTKKKYNLFPNVVYVFIGDPIKKLFLSSDNFHNFTVEGVYFTGNAFIEVTSIEGQENFTYSLIQMPFNNIKEVTYSVKFIPKEIYKDADYFGNRFATDYQFIKYYDLNNIRARCGQQPDGLPDNLDDLLILHDDKFLKRSIFNNGEVKPLTEEIFSKAFVKITAMANLDVSDLHRTIEEPSDYINDDK